MSTTEAEQLHLVTPEYAVAVEELSRVANAVMDQYPDDVKPSWIHLRLPLKTPGCRDNEYYVVSKTGPYPQQANTDWASITPQIDKVVEFGSTDGYTIDYRDEGGVLTQRISEYCNNEIMDELGFQGMLTTDDVQKLLSEIRCGIPYNDEHEDEPRKGRLAGFIGHVLQGLRRK